MKRRVEKIGDCRLYYSPLLRVWFVNKAGVFVGFLFFCFGHPCEWGYWTYAEHEANVGDTWNKAKALNALLKSLRA